ncbi:hypothetical protein HF1_02530 [Mycoplasma haemofelis str. Langford 1]|uniref:Uncharacterized protein n=1 Tax=Mycoplasma haemofelis (strain Langford 1) TaxID=941640 RepID=E8ZKU5_MYCHL|nr:hypothetical protein [Mycoplasma haemofelis]CBY92261.1 hypothetical protein HF1_02530 [Mycoplasma haemofelis str. Langford 1]
MWKAAAGVLGAGTAAAGGALAYKELSKPKTYSIKSLLISKNQDKRLLVKDKDGSSTEWKAAWKAYLNSGNNIWKLPEWKTPPVAEEKAPNSFMDACSSNSGVMVESVSSQEYKNVLSFCTRDTVVKDLIEESGRVLNSDTNGGWSKSWKSYRDLNKDKEKTKDSWQLTDWESSKASDDAISADFKKKCNDKLALKTNGREVDDYQNIIDWCSMPK